MTDSTTLAGTAGDIARSMDANASLGGDMSLISRLAAGGNIGETRLSSSLHKLPARIINARNTAKLSRSTRKTPPLSMLLSSLQRVVQELLTSRALLVLVSAWFVSSFIRANLSVPLEWLLPSAYSAMFSYKVNFSNPSKAVIGTGVASWIAWCLFYYAPFYILSIGMDIATISLSGQLTDYGYAISFLWTALHFLILGVTPEKHFLRILAAFAVTSLFLSIISSCSLFLWREYDTVCSFLGVNVTTSPHVTLISVSDTGVVLNWHIPNVTHSWSSDNPPSKITWQTDFYPDLQFLSVTPLYGDAENEYYDIEINGVIIGAIKDNTVRIDGLTPNEKYHVRIYFQSPVARIVSNSVFVQIIPETVQMDNTSSSEHNYHVFTFIQKQKFKNIRYDGSSGEVESNIRAIQDELEILHEDEHQITEQVLEDEQSALKELSNLQKELDELRDTKRAEVETIRLSQKAELKSLEDARKVFESKKYSLEQQQQAMQTSKEDYDEFIREKEAAIKMYKNTLTKTVNEHAEIELSLTSKKIALQQETSQLRKKVQEIQGVLTAKTKDLDKVKAETIVKKEELRYLSEELNNVQNEYRGMEELLEQRQEQLLRSQLKFNEVLAENARLDAHLRDTGKMKMKLMQDLAQARRESEMSRLTSASNTIPALSTSLPSTKVFTRPITPEDAFENHSYRQNPFQELYGQHIRYQEVQPAAPSQSQQQYGLPRLQQNYSTMYHNTESMFNDQLKTLPQRSYIPVNSVPMSQNMPRIRRDTNRFVHNGPDITSDTNSSSNGFNRFSRPKPVPNSGRYTNYTREKRQNRPYEPVADWL